MMEGCGPGLEGLVLCMAVMVKVDQKHRTQHYTRLNPDTDSDSNADSDSDN